MELTRFPRRRYTEGSTPLHALPRFSAAIAPNGGGPNVFIKRDDMLGLTPGGNKTRKLEFLVGDALRQGCDTLITCGAVQSNHCRLTLAAAIQEGLRCRLLLEERVAGSYRPDANGNNFLFRLLGAEAIEVVPGGSDLMVGMQRMAQAVAREGRKAYIIPTGGSNAIGGLGYAACAQELVVQNFDLGLRFDCIVVASGSSGTHGGLLAGLWGLHADIPVIGIGVSREPADQEPLVHAEAVAVAELIGLREPVPRERVRTIGGYWQPKYSVPNARMVEAVQLLARTEAIVLDPTYTGKAMAGLIGLARDGTLRAGQNVLFLHTGGLPAAFADMPALLGEVPVAP